VSPISPLVLFISIVAFLAWLAYKDYRKLPHAGRKDEPINIDGEEEEKKISGEECHDAAKKVHRPHLIVVPASVLSNWEREFSTFAPHLNVVKYYGSMQEREEIKNEMAFHLPGREQSRRRHNIEPLDVVLAPITYFQKEKSDDRSFLRKFAWSYLIVDEAHMLKNNRGSRYKNLDRFESEHRLLLTGTPVQNSPKELLNLLCFLMPLFSRRSSGGYDDEDETNDSSERMLKHFVSIENGRNGSSSEASFYKIKQLFAPFVLRRKKEDVLSQILPPKERRVEFVELDDRARSLYDSILSDHIKSKTNGDANSRDHLFTQLRYVPIILILVLFIDLNDINACSERCLVLLLIDVVRFDLLVF